MKKLTTLLIAIIFVVSAGTANAQLITPEDVPMLVEMPDPTFFMGFMENYDPAMGWAFENDILTGDGTTGDLRELDCVKRAELLKMLYNVLEVDTANPQAELFSDTPSNQWYINYVKKARERGTVAGYPDGTFKPAQCVNRAEAVKMALLEFPNVNPISTKIDAGDVPESEWYFQYVSYALGNNIVGLQHSGFSNFYYPGESMSRSEFAEMLYRLKTLQDNNLKSYEDGFGPENFEKMPIQDYDLEPEEFFEYDTSLLITLNTQNQNQVDILDDVLRYTPAGSVDEYMGLLYESISDEISPAFDDGTKVMFAAGGFDGKRPIEALIFTVNNGNKLEAAFESLSSKPDFSKSTLFGFKTFDNREDGTYYAYTDDVMATWSTPGDRYLALQKIKNNEKNLLQNTQYNTFIKSIPSANVGTVYFKMSTSETGILAVVPHTSGVKLYYRLDGLGVEVSDVEPYMYKNVPGNDLMMYGESYGLLDLYGDQRGNIVTELQNSELMVSDGNWLNNGFAFAMHDTGTLIPSMAMYFDAADYVADARQDLEALDIFFDAIIAQMDEEEPDMAGVIMKDNVSVDGNNFSRVTLDLGAVPAEQVDSDLEMLTQFVETPMEFYYGITDDNYVVFALYSGFENVLGVERPVGSNSDIKEGMAMLTGYPNGLSYLSFEKVLGYMDLWVAEVEKTEPMPVEMKETYNQIMDYLAPIKYTMDSAKEVSEGDAGLIFVKVN